MLEIDDFQVLDSCFSEKRKNQKFLPLLRGTFGGKLQRLSRGGDKVLWRDLLRFGKSSGKCNLKNALSSQ
jgi:hypothetical protein